MSRRYPGPLYVTPTPFTTQHRYHVQVFLVFLSLTLCDRIPVTPPEPGPAPLQASGFRPSGLPTPVSPGVPAGARNLGVCDFSLLLPFKTFHLVFRLPLVVLHPISATAFPRSLSNTLLPLSRSLAFSFPHPTLCYRPPYFRLSLLLTHPRVSPAYFLRTPQGPPCHPFGTSGEGG